MKHASLGNPRKIKRSGRRSALSIESWRTRRFIDLTRANTSSSAASRFQRSRRSHWALALTSIKVGNCRQSEIFARRYSLCGRTQRSRRNPALECGHRYESQKSSRLDESYLLNEQNSQPTRFGGRNV